MAVFGFELSSEFAIAVIWSAVDFTFGEGGTHPAITNAAKLAGR